MMMMMMMMIPASRELLSRDSPATILHGCKEMPKTMLDKHDLPVDVVATPTGLIRCGEDDRIQKPAGYKCLPFDQAVRGMT
eukprot:5855930-Amphidinium_carterae.1